MKKFLTIIFLAVGVFTSSFASAVKAPDFNLKDLTGKEYSLSKYRGKKVFLIFWSESCTYCRMELPLIEKLYKEYNENKDDVIFITFSKDELEPLQKFLEETKYTFPIIRDSSIFNKYLISATPTHYIIGESGEVIQNITGLFQEDEFHTLIKESTTQLNK